MDSVLSFLALKEVKMVFLTSLESIIPIVLIISLGYILKSRGMFNETFSSNLSRFIMTIALPAGIFVAVMHHMQLKDFWSLRYGLLTVIVSFIVSYIVAFILMKVCKIPRGRRGTFINMMLNVNCLFIGLPVQIALFGQDALEYFLIYYIINTISVWMIGVYLIELDPLPNNNDTSTSNTSKFKISWQKLLPPPLIGFIVSLVFVYGQIPLHPVLFRTLSYLGSMVTPLALLYIGISLYDAGLKSLKFNKDVISAIVARFVVAPLVMYFVILVVQSCIGMTLQPMITITFIVQSALPVMAVLPILANEFGADVPYATSLVTISTILFIIVIPVIMELLTMIGIVA